MRNKKNNFNTVKESTCILTPKDASIFKTTKSLLLTDEPKSIIHSVDLLFNGFLMSELAEGQETRTEVLYHYNVVKEFLTNLKNL